MWNFVFFARRKNDTGVYLFVFFFHGGSYQHSGPRIPEECSFERTLKVIVPFLSDQKMGGQLASLFSKIV